MIHAPHLKELPNVEHAFGTRQDDAWLGESNHAWLKQIHSAIIREPKAPGFAGDGDALVTTAPELWISIRTADCLPILLVDPSAMVAAAVHAGWRGTAARIVAQTLLRMQELGAQVSDIRAAIGPGIGKSAYEVGPEVASQFGLAGRTCLDLAKENERQLLDGGLDLEQIWHAKRCTFSEADSFHSFRRDGEAAGRMLSAIRLL